MLPQRQHAAIGQKSFDVVVMPSAAAFGCNLDVSIPKRYLLHVVDDVGFFLKETKRTSKTSVASVDDSDPWQLKLIWKFDQIIRSSCPKQRLFTFMAGRRSTSGEGEFHLQTNTDEEAHEILNIVQRWAATHHGRKSDVGFSPTSGRRISNLNNEEELGRNWGERRFTADGCLTVPVYAKVNKKKSHEYCENDADSGNQVVSDDASKKVEEKKHPPHSSNDGVNQPRKRTTSMSLGQMLRHKMSNAKTQSTNSKSQTQPQTNMDVVVTGVSSTSNHPSESTKQASRPRNSTETRSRSISQSAVSSSNTTPKTPRNGVWRIIKHILLPYLMPITLGLYDVIVMPTAAATRCQLETSKPDRYRLQFIDNGIIVKERTISEQNYGWRQLYHLRYDFIRRYGKRTNVFIIEAGRSCETGEGEFRFQSTDADKMFNLFRCTTEDILNQQQKSSERGIDVVPAENGDSKRTNRVADTTNNVSNENASGSSLPIFSKGQLIENNEQPKTSPLPSLLRSGSSSSNHPTPTTTKDDIHVYSQVQKKRMAPNIPPRGTSLRKPNGFAANSKSVERVPITTSDNNHISRRDSLSSTTPRAVPLPLTVDKREPIYAELMQTSCQNTAAQIGPGSKNRTTKARCRSPTPLIDNFLKMEGLTQYATVVNVLPPQSTTPKSAQNERQSGSELPSHNGNRGQTGDLSQNGNASITAVPQNELISPISSSANQKKKAKTKTQKSEKVKQHNDENKHSSSWFSFFSGGNKKPSNSS